MELAKLLTVISAALTVVISAISIWSIGNKIVKRLAIIQNRLSSLKALYLSLHLRQADSEQYLANKHGYNVRNYSTEIEKSLLKEYESEDTGF